MSSSGQPDYEGEGMSELELSFMSDVSANDSLFIPSPRKSVKYNLSDVSVPKRICFVDLSSFDQFIQQMNRIRRCVTPGCNGRLVPIDITSIGLGGAISVKYTCSGCVEQHAHFEASCKYDIEYGSMSEIGMAVQVAFIVAGCTHATYYRALKLALGIDAVSAPTFMNTIQVMYPIVKGMVDDMCEEAKNEMKAMDQSLLGSWSRAVTTADGTWLTRGFHSKNATFSIRNYFNGALLYYKHLCQRGRDNVVLDDLYMGTSKGAEGYAANITFKQAKDEGMHIEVHWQDADSSSSNAVTKHFPNAKIMLCGGHAGRAHKKQLEKLAKMKSFSHDFKKKHNEKFPQVDIVACCCPSRHHPGCGCLSDAFIERARNNFSFVLSQAQSAEEFKTKLNALPRHARDEHIWDEGQCDFHPVKVCSCGKCPNKSEFKCEGKDYHTKFLLSCPLHSLAYEIECNERASMASELVHPVLKRGHSNWLEASHNVFIRFRPKHLHLERLHYEVSTNLGLLQSNMTYLYDKRGPAYHWIPILYNRLKLPLFDGLQEQLELHNRKRKESLGYQKTESSKKKRIELKKQRTTEAHRRKEWSKKHGQDDYGSLKESHEDLPPKRSKSISEGKCRCGSDTHIRTTHRDCPLNKNNLKHECSPILSHDHANREESMYMSDTPTCTSSFSELSSSDEDSFDDLSIPECTCNTSSRAHKKSCPLNSRNFYSCHDTFTRDSSGKKS